jgi:LmbE family N-acetylglucosaminyl deacetylase
MATKVPSLVPVLEPTTTEQTWMTSLRLLPELMPRSQSTVIVAPHPDDETLAAGGFIATLRSLRIPVSIMAVTDGEAAYSDTPDLGGTRRIEQAHAAEALGVAPGAIIRLGLRDSAVAESEMALTARIEECIDSDTVLVAPWPGDPHPDHEACGRASVTAASRTGATLIFYFFWTWHRSRPECLKGLQLRRLELSGDARSRRARALTCHYSQLHRKEGPPVLPEIFLAPARRPFETFAIYDDQHGL